MMRGRESHFLPHSCLEVNEETFESYLYPVFHLLKQCLATKLRINEQTNALTFFLLYVKF